MIKFAQRETSLPSSPQQEFRSLRKELQSPQNHRTCIMIGTVIYSCVCVCVCLLKAVRGQKCVTHGHTHEQLMGVRDTKSSRYAPRPVRWVLIRLGILALQEHPLNVINFINRWTDRYEIRIRRKSFSPRFFFVKFQ